MTPTLTNGLSRISLRLRNAITVTVLSGDLDKVSGGYNTRVTLSEPHASRARDTLEDDIWVTKPL